MVLRLLYLEAVEETHQAAAVAVGAGHCGGVAVLGVVRQYAAVIYAGGTVGGAGDSTHVARLADLDVLQHDVADGGTGGGGEQRFVEPADDREGTVALSLRRQRPAERDYTCIKAACVDIVGNDIVAT